MYPHPIETVLHSELTHPYPTRSSRVHILTYFNTKTGSTYLCLIENPRSSRFYVRVMRSDQSKKNYDSSATHEHTSSVNINIMTFVSRVVRNRYKVMDISFYYPTKEHVLRHDIYLVDTPFVCNTIHFSIQNLSSNIMHFEGQNSIFH
jgi:hypothetical protein